MRFARMLKFVVYGAIVSTMVGCTTFKYQDIVVAVREIETRRAIHGAQVAIVHSRTMFQTSAPRDSVGITNIHGEAELRLAVDSIQPHLLVNGECFGLRILDGERIEAARTADPRPRLVDVQIRMARE